MILSELITAVSKEFPHLYKDTVEEAVKVLFDTIGEGAKEGKTIVLKNFGRFKMEERNYPNWNLKEHGEKVAELPKRYRRLRFYPFPTLERYINGEVDTLKIIRPKYKWKRKGYDNSSS